MPGDDIATSLLQAEVDGERLTDLEFNMFFLLLINAGGDTTRNLVAAGILALMEHPAEQARLAADPSLLPTAIEEMLRYTSPVTVFVRTATKDTELRGIPVKSGDRAAMFYPSANRDETRFADPDRFDIGRAPNPHLAFGGGGTHFCLGANLARVEASAIIPEVLSRMKDLELAGPVERVRSNTHERHPTRCRSVSRASTVPALTSDGPLRQRKLLTYLPMSMASWRLTPDGCPVPKSGLNSWYGPTAVATNA